MSEFFKKLQRGLFSKSYYPQDRFLCEKLTMEQKVKKTVSDAKDKFKELVLGEKKNEDCPYVIIDVEESHVRKITGVRQTGGEQQPNMFQLIHEKESQFLLGIVPGKLPYPATSPPPDLSSDRPYFPDDPDSDNDDEDFGLESKNHRSKNHRSRNHRSKNHRSRNPRTYMRRSRLTSLGESHIME